MPSQFKINADERMFHVREMSRDRFEEGRPSTLRKTEIMQ